MQYRLTCDKCGRAYPVEPRRAGGSLTCECGETLTIPTMLKMKRLPEWDEKEVDDKQEEVQPVETKQDAAAPSSPDRQENAAESPADAAPKSSGLMKRITGLSGKRWGLFIVAALILVFCSAKIGMNISQPDPRSVFYKKINYTNDGKAIRRDSSPITVNDYAFYFLQDPEHPYVITDQLIDAFNDFYAYQYFDYVKELDMSDNFYDNYEALLTKWRLYLTFYFIVAGLSLIAALCALFIKESHKQVGVSRGESWK